MFSQEKRLSRKELMALLQEQTHKNERLEQEMQEKEASYAQTIAEKDQVIAAREAELAERKLDIQDSGTMAEAALRINRVFEATDAACAQYLENVRRISEEAERKCALLEQKTAERCSRMIEESREASQSYWDKVYNKLEQYRAEHNELQSLLQFKEAIVLPKEADSAPDESVKPAEAEETPAEESKAQTPSISVVHAEPSDAGVA